MELAIVVLLSLVVLNGTFRNVLMYRNFRLRVRNEYRQVYLNSNLRNHVVAEIATLVKRRIMSDKQFDRELEGL